MMVKNNSCVKNFMKIEIEINVGGETDFSACISSGGEIFSSETQIWLHARAVYVAKINFSHLKKTEKLKLVELD